MADDPSDSRYPSAEESLSTSMHPVAVLLSSRALESSTAAIWPWREKVSVGRKFSSMTVLCSKHSILGRRKRMDDGEGGARTWKRARDEGTCPIFLKRERELLLWKRRKRVSIVSHLDVHHRTLSFSRAWIRERHGLCGPTRIIARQQYGCILSYIFSRIISLVSVEKKRKF